MRPKDSGARALGIVASRDCRTKRLRDKALWDQRTVGLKDSGTKALLH